MSSDHMEDKAASFEALSALADGESTERDVARACQAWRESDDARGRWQTYHLIGDAMRSDGLAATHSSDANFLAGLRDRLAQEPVVLAPAPLATKTPTRHTEPLPGALDGQVARQRRWAGPLSVAAGFVLVVGGVINVINQGGVMPGASTPGSVAALAQSSNVQGQGVNALTQASWSVPDAPLPPGVSSILRSGLSADGVTVGQRVASARPTFTQNGRVEADGHTGYLIFVRDDQLDQLLAAQRSQQPESRSLVSSSTPSSDMIRTVSFDASRP